ncbi:hypothetical protein A2U01_0076804 [Trifolium medium]|uniref:Uncharacterized protein n=1 Tax=Trifolium medium TaxID=97028 RepID=A0A392T350_9FABA|nr:hypothetical protein [Trifolium medium]
MHESMYNMQLNQQVMSPADFQAHLAWPGDRPHFREGADVADDNDIDEAAADAVEDDDQSGDEGDDGDDDQMSD